MAKTLREKYIEALTSEGFMQVKDRRSSKYVIFKRTENSYWYIGKSGSLRVGATISASVPVSDKFKARLLELGARGKVI